MQIESWIYEQILNKMPTVPPETGGILGWKRPRWICAVDFDRGIPAPKGMQYCPDVGRLNAVIEEWGKKSVRFAGIFHSHRAGNEKLSKEDLRYAKMIMNTMPDDIETLYFPIVIPGQKMIPYLARRTENGEIDIREDEIIIL